MYRAILFAPDGDYVTDYRGTETIAEVEELLSNQGSKWYFYPFEAVIRDDGSPLFSPEAKRLVSIGFPLEDFQGREVQTLRRYLEALTDEERTELLSF